MIVLWSRALENLALELFVPCRFERRRAVDVFFHPCGQIMIAHQAQARRRLFGRVIGGRQRIDLGSGGRHLTFFANRGMRDHLAAHRDQSGKLAGCEPCLPR